MYKTVQCDSLQSTLGMLELFCCGSNCALSTELDMTLCSTQHGVTTSPTHSGHDPARLTHSCSCSAHTVCIKPWCSAQLLLRSVSQCVPDCAALCWYKLIEVTGLCVSQCSSRRDPGSESVPDQLRDRPQSI